MSLGLGLDAGGSATRWVLAKADGVVLARGEAPPLSGLMFLAGEEATAREAVAALAAAVRARATPDAVLAGVTGSAEGSEPAEAMRVVLAGAFGLPRARVRVVDDLWIAHRARFAPGSGILVYAGTGSIAYHVAANGGTVRAGGHGHLIDDAGSGFAIARDALRTVLRREDAAPGSGWARPLGAALAGRIGGTSWDVVRAFAYGATGAAAGRARIAGLAPCVAEAARAGDAEATAILSQAGRDLARLAASLFGRLGPQPVGLAGRAARLHPLIAAAMADALGVTPDLREIDAALAAARIAGDPSQAGSAPGAVSNPNSSSSDTRADR